jgi:hypothetical protein
MQKRVVKTTDQILKANLNRTLNRLKKQVAEKEALWGEYFFEALGYCIMEQLTNDFVKEVVIKSRIELASMIADECLEQYEKRWGKVEEGKR